MWLYVLSNTKKRLMLKDFIILIIPFGLIQGITAVPIDSIVQHSISILVLFLSFLTYLDKRKKRKK